MENTECFFTISLVYNAWYYIVYYLHCYLATNCFPAFIVLTTEAFYNQLSTYTLIYLLKKGSFWRLLFLRKTCVSVRWTELQLKKTLNGSQSPRWNCFITQLPKLHVLHFSWMLIPITWPGPHCALRSILVF